MDTLEQVLFSLLPWLIVLSVLASVIAFFIALRHYLDARRASFFILRRRAQKKMRAGLVAMAFCLLFTFNAAAAETKAESPAVSETGKVQAASIKPVNINKADVKALTSLEGIGKDRAQKIVEYREKNGPFQKVEDLMKEFCGCVDTCEQYLNWKLAFFSSTGVLNNQERLVKKIEKK